MAFIDSQVHVHGNSSNIVYGPQINSVYRDNSESQQALRFLAHHTAPNACYDSEQRFPPPKCHPETRGQLINDLAHWIEDHSKTTSILWLNGTAGIGKSAIAQYIAEKYAASGKLIGTFFFSRNDPTRDNIRRFVASVAYQCSASCETRSDVADAICRDPNIFHTSLENQLRKLILVPYSRMEPDARSQFPNLLIVDGLDECIDPVEQERVVALLEELITTTTCDVDHLSSPPPKWNILVCSRPEPQIRDAFHHRSFYGTLETFNMNTLDDLNHDIERYFIDQFSLLRSKRRSVLKHEGPLWPGNNAISELVRRADGQFIFAATVVKYIDTRTELPQDRLLHVLRVRISVEANMVSPYPALDALYCQILSTYPIHTWEDMVKPILRLLVSPHERGACIPYMCFPGAAWRSIAMIGQFLDLRKAEVQLALAGLHSVLYIPKDDEEDMDISIVHASFTEFLVDPLRSRQFHTPRMSWPEYCDCLATCSLHTLSNILSCSVFAPPLPSVLY